jgi:hypothetical protein
VGGHFDPPLISRDANFSAVSSACRSKDGVSADGRRLVSCLLLRPQGSELLRYHQL